MQALGMWSYWILALFAMLEAIVLTGAIAPGALAIMAGGILVQRGAIDFFDLAWFVAGGAILGSEISYRLGGLTAQGLKGRQRLAGSHHIQRAQGLLTKYGGFAMILGRFLGPLSAFVPFSAALAGMSQRRFTLWNIVSSIPYALGLPAIGYFFGSALGTFGAAAPRMLAFGIGLLAILGLFWFLLGRLRRAWPMMMLIARSVTSGIAARPTVRGLVARFPRLTRFVTRRFNTARFMGLTATVLALLFLYLLGAYLDSVIDYTSDASVTQADTRLANLLYAMRDARLTAIFGWITALGSWQISLPMLGGAGAALLLLRRHDLLGGLVIAVMGNQLTVAILKSFFDRPRSPLGYFIETSGSFPSGHAAASIAVWGMLFYIAWRLRYLSSAVAGMAAVTLAFFIGFSRIYLVEHYLSDVLNGWLIGALWLTVGVAFCEWRREFRVEMPSAKPSRQRWAAIYNAAALGTSLVLASTLSEPLNKIDTRVSYDSAQIASLLETKALPVQTETLTGAPRAPIAMLVDATGSRHLISRMEALGWTRATRPGLGTLTAAVSAEWTGGDMPSPLVISTFWDTRPNDLAFSKKGVDLGAMRLHARFWMIAAPKTDASTIIGSVIVEDPLYVLDETSRLPPRDMRPAAALAAALQKAGFGVTRVSGLLE
ncbi:bifunctional DedA family/phosphatase PAP2 family protein [Roseovarius nanhaiticus]|uniref:bifunctional DedA family/phosphatase PAP2 family protein n=1 Tax=Roseovarius nanhaiticus TaxID=573024 RepID=UPI00249311C8|nr:bifunctional DedA family/phosphatase PAP2 family protein [Roseovarius nanhaiticus]